MKDESPLIELNQKEVVRVAFKKKILVRTGIFICLIIVIAMSLKLLAFMETLYFEKAKSFLAKTEEIADEKLFKKNLEDAIISFKTAFLLNTINVFNPSLSRGKICYFLGNAYLLNDENDLAEKCFKTTKTFFSGNETYTTLPEIEFKLLQSRISVNGIIDGNRAMVNGYIVKEGDFIREIEVVKITDNDVMFNVNGSIFVRSMDKDEVSVKTLKMKYYENFQAIQLNKKFGIACDKFVKLKNDIIQFLKVYRMDSAQQNEMRLLSSKCDEEIRLINEEIDAKKRQNKIVEGMSKDDVLYICGEPLSKNRLLEMNVDEKWVYEDKVLYFRDEDTEGNSLLVIIEDIREDE